MSQINFVAEFRAIMEACRRDSVPGRTRLLWIALFYLANDRAREDEQTGAWEWPDDFFPVNNAELATHCPLEKRAILEARNRLKQMGVIDFKAGDNALKPAKYRFRYLTCDQWCKNAPQHAPQEVPQHAPQGAPNYININRDIRVNPKENDTHTDVNHIIHRAGAGARRQDTEVYKTAEGETKPCRFDWAFKTSDRARMAVAQRILDRFDGELDSENAHFRICEMLHDGMEPEIFEDEIGKYSSLREYIAAMATIFHIRGYEERRDQVEKRHCLKLAHGNLRLADFYFKHSPRYRDEEEA